jgi:hypothetical protein
VKQRANGPNVCARVDDATFALLGRGEDEASCSLNDEHAVFATLIEREQLDGLPRSVRPTRANAVKAKVPVNDTIRVRMRKLHADIERDLDGLGDRERMVLLQDSR